MDGSVLGSILAGGLLLFLGSLIGFFFGLSFGAHSVQALFGDGFLSTTTSWVVGFFAGLIFALLSYLFWVFAVALVAGSLGYALVAGFFSLFGADLDVLVWILGVVVGIAFGVAAVVLNLQKAIVIVATALLGAYTIVGTFLFLFEPGATPKSLAEGGAKMIMDDHPLWFLIFAVVAAVGMIFQFQVNRSYEVTRYNRWEASMGGIEGTSNDAMA
jgi:hypothetical protein